MSKVKRFSLEERYGYQNRKVIYDKDADNDIELNSIYPIIDLLNKYDKKIAELQKQLEEKKKEIEKIRKLHSIRDDASQWEIVNGVKFNAEQIMIIALLKENMTLATNEYKKLYFDGINRIKELEQQLKSQPVEIVEKIKEQLIKRLNTIAGYGRMTTDELSFLIEAEFGSDLDNILKEYQN